jgi:hypothetical protein
MLMNGLTVQSYGVIYTEPNTAWNLQGGEAQALVTTYKPIITSQPQATVTVNQGSPFTLSATAVGNPGSLTYQWYKNGNLISTQTWPSGTACTNTIFSASPYDGGTWYVVVTNSIGSTQSISVTVTVVANHVVSGQVLLANGGTGVPGVTVSLNTTPTATIVTTDSGGNYSLPNIPDGSYTLTPSLSGASALFFPATLPVTVAGVDVANLQIQAAVGYTVSGTVSYLGSKAGRIYLTLDGGSTGSAPGVSISSKGAFTIHGVPPGTYTLNAWMDNIGQGNLNASNPTGSTASITVGFGDYAGANVTLADPAAIDLTGITPAFDVVAPMDGGAFIRWKNVKNGQGVEKADQYQIQWSTSSSFTSPTTALIPALGKNNPMYFASGLTNNTPYYFRIYGMAGSSTSNASATYGPITPNPGAGANTVSGTVTFPGTATGPLYVGLYDMNLGVPYAVPIANPVSPQAFSIHGVPTGSAYFLFAIVDQNHNGYVDAGDINNVNGSGNNQTVSVSGDLAGQTISFPSTGATTSLITQHQSYTGFNSNSWQSYALQFSVGQNIKLPVNVTLQLGSALLDVGNQASQGNGYYYWLGSGSISPNTGDNYAIQVGYSDGSSETIPVAVGPVLSSFPTGLSPNTTTPGGATPTFTWAAPSSAPSLLPYTYSLWLSQLNAGTIWSYPTNGSNMPSSQTSVTFNTDGSASVTSLTSGMTYVWSLSVVDAAGNQAQQTVEFKP